MDNSNLPDNEKQSGVNDNAAEILNHRRASIQPLHPDIIPEDNDPEPLTVPEIKSTNKSVSNSIIDNLSSTNKKEETQLPKNPETYGLPSYQKETPVVKRKPLYGVYVLAFILLANAVDAFAISTRLSGGLANFVRLLSAIGLLLGVGLIMKKEYARILTIALLLFLAILNFGFFQRIIYAGVIIYLFLPSVKDEFDS